MSPEWDWFVTAVKLNKGLKETNRKQLYAYMKQHVKHAAQDRLIIKRITPMTNDKLAFVSSVQPYTQSSPVESHQYPPSAPLLSPHVQSLSYLQFGESSQLASGYTQANEILDTLTKQNVQGRHNQTHRNFARGNGEASNKGAQIRAGNVNAEVRAMKTIFENFEAEVDQNAIDLKSCEIERKDLLITNENLIANCIALDVVFIVTDSAMTTS
nr:integrase, catalytic region, zinc finger, CCHC-type, peptidase aspartic, catalytic [Tanacetum cinerariifolium]